jgi:integrase/recombinase XerD
MITIRIVLDDRKKKLDGVYSVKLRVTFERQQKYYLTGFKMCHDEFKQTMRDVPPKRFQNTKAELDEMVLKARNVLKGLSAFSFLGFEKKFLNNAKPEESLFDLYQVVIDAKYKRGTIGTAINYRCSMRSLKKYCGKLTYIDLTPELLRDYENHLLSEGKKVTTIGIYMRPLRAIINEAIALGYLARELYPFGRRKYVIPEGRNPKKALNESDFKKVWSYECNDAFGFEARSRDFFILSYLCQGANFKDLLLLRKEQITENEIRFVRQKTKETGRSNPVLITVPVLDEAKVIIEKWKTKDNQSPFVFGFIKPEMTPEQVYKTNMQFVKVTNKHMAQIAALLNIEKQITTYVARHQFSKAIIDGGESVEYLSECLGHSSIKVTKSYIQRFSFEKRIETAKKLVLPKI